jgi:hypothetical protein
MIHWHVEEEVVPFTVVFGSGNHEGGGMVGRSALVRGSRIQVKRRNGKAPKVYEWTELDDGATGLGEKAPRTQS